MANRAAGTLEGRPGRANRPSCRGSRRYESIVVEKVSKLEPETVIGPHTSVIGGLHFGWNDATSVRSNVAFPFWTGKSPSAARSCLFAARGFLPPLFTHLAVASTTGPVGSQGKERRAGR